ncbi:MAG: glycosyltransferase family 4 protein [Planctomycetota bacterium]|nr:glycosyltransferase family 4 protein [Planctomycetota bacterium]
MPLNILFFVRPDLTDLPGGDTLQVLATAQALRQFPLPSDSSFIVHRSSFPHVTISSDPNIDLDPYHCVHLFHLERPHETYIYLLAALHAQKPIALSTIYWPETRRPRPHSILYRSRRHFWREDAKNIIRCLLARTPLERKAASLAIRTGFARCRQELLEFASILLPNSQAEADLIAKECRHPQRFVVTPNVIDLAACQNVLASPNPHAAPSLGPPHDILCVGHFDPRKNQLGLIHALAGLDVSVTFIGAPRRMHRRYYRQCLLASHDQHRFLGPLPHPAILQYMRSAHAHICPSRYETPGLVNLEAAVMGLAVVAPDCPPVREYLKNHAIYFQPDDLDSLRTAVVLALNHPPTPELARHVSENYTLQALAQTTLHAYSMIVH